MQHDDQYFAANVRHIMEYSRKTLFAALDSLEGQKTIVWDRSLMKRVNVFAGPSVLEKHDVVANMALDKQHVTNTPHAVFFLAPTLSALDQLCTYIDACGKESKSLYQVFFIPEAWYVVREKLKERSEGKYFERLESVQDIPLWWMPQDGECLSLAVPELTSRLLINGDWTYLYKCAYALHQVKSMCSGDVPIYSKGKWAQDVVRMLSTLGPPAESLPVKSLCLNRIVIIDRWLDPLTPLLTQLTYAGLLDELYRVSMVGSIKVLKAEFEQKEDADPFELKEIYLLDEIYHRLKHSHINAIGHELGGILQEIRNDEEYDREKMSIAEYQVLVKKMPQILKKKEMCNMHMRLAEMIQAQLYDSFVDYIKVQKDLLESSNWEKVVTFIEDLILDAADVSIVLRMIAIHSLTAGGFKPSVLAAYRRMVMQSYGTDAVSKLLKMQKMGLIRERGGSGKLVCDHSLMNYPQIRKQYELIIDDVHEADKTNPAYAYSGYCSLLCRILAEGDKIKWAGWNKLGDYKGGEDDKTAVFIVGGVTRAELAIIKQLPNISLVLTSALLVGDSLVDKITTI
ncbi:unnamed protein product [Auanema sp. JU1783]|nr:unnamed protein product [Auanema sp. JU1783]